MKKWILIFSVILLACGAAVYVSLPPLPPEAEGNRRNLWAVLLHYRWVDHDRQKLEAARFLIDNMPYHRGKGRLVHVPEEMKRWRREADSLYASVRLAGMEEKDWQDSLKRMRTKRLALLKDSVMQEAAIDDGWFDDIQCLSYRFLVDHIDNAFRMWRRSVFARNLSFEEFKEYLLPYRSVAEYGFHVSGREWQEWFGKYVPVDGTAALREAVRGYNQAANNVQGLNGSNRREVPAGQYDFYVGGKLDCVDIAHYGCNILRACGLPVVVEFNMSYLSLPGRHYHCDVWYDAKGEWRTFNAQSALPGDRDWAFSQVTNVYRMTYGARKDTPYFLKNPGERVPELLDDPCIEDVTSNLRETVTLTVPCRVPAANRLAYLATFHKESGGLIAVTWGTEEAGRDSVTFRHVLPDVLYFPVYYAADGVKAAGEPFYVKIKDKRAEVHTLPGIQTGVQERETLVLRRKYPRKPNMVKVANELVGGRFLGANRKDFSDAVTLYEIKEPPSPYFLDYPLKRTGRFRYYRFQTTKERPRANISMLEWIASSGRGYANVLPATRPDMLRPADTVRLAEEQRWVKLLDAPWKDMVWKAEYDGNRQTAPGAYPNITLWLKEPQVVSRVRFAPLNADNGIHGGDWYRLHYWEEDGWQSVGTVQADYEYVVFDNVPAHKLYWLENLTKGQEEMPFVMEDGEQRFLYGDII